MKTSDIAQAVVDRLKLFMFPEFKVEHFPNAPDRYPFASAQRELLVTYERSSYGEAESISPISVTRTPEITVTTLVRSLRGPQGVDTTLDRVRACLFGWRLQRRVQTAGPGPSDPPLVTWVPLGGTALVPTLESFHSEDQGVWRFVSAFRFTTPEVAYEPPIPTLADGPITDIEFDSP